MYIKNKKKLKNVIRRLFYKSNVHKPHFLGFLCFQSDPQRSHSIAQDTNPKMSAKEAPAYLEKGQRWGTYSANESRPNFTKKIKDWLQGEYGL